MKPNIIDKMKNEEQNLIKPRNSVFNICLVIARFIPFVGLAISDRKHISNLFVLYHWVGSSMIGVYIGVKIVMCLNVL